MKPLYKRVLLKLSGEALMQGFEKNGKNQNKGIIDFEFLNVVCEKIKVLVDMGVEVAIVVGGGNIWRGAKNQNFDRVRADYMGMLATTINSLGIQDFLIQNDVTAKVMTAIDMERCAEPFNRQKALEMLNKKEVIVFGCGLGTPFFSTDTAAVVRAAEIGADIVLFAKNIDGVYDKDPAKYSDAIKVKEITYNEILEKKLAVIDSTAAAFAQSNNITMLVFGLNDPENIVRAVLGENIGSIINEK